MIIKYSDFINEMESSLTDKQIACLNTVVKGKWVEENGKINVTGDVNFSYQKTMEKFPVNFGKVSGNFNCTECISLLSLIGAPYSVGGNFICSNCDSLTTLIGLPDIVGGIFSCVNSMKLGSCWVAYTYLVFKNPHHQHETDFDKYEKPKEFIDFVYDKLKKMTIKTDHDIYNKLFLLLSSEQQKELRSRATANKFKL